MSTFELEHFIEFRDSSEILLSKKRRQKELYSLDSVAAIYNKNVTHIFAFKRSDEPVHKIISENQDRYKNVLFVDGQKTLFSGYHNDKKMRSGFMQAYIIVDKNGKLIYDCNIISNHHIVLARFLKTLPNKK